MSDSNIPPELLANARARSSAFTAKLERAMRKMELEIEHNEGIYPLNGGRVSIAELCRRADVSDITLHTKVHRNTTRMFVQRWIDQIKCSTVQGKKQVRRTVTDRAERWKDAFNRLATKVHIDELTFISLSAAVKEANSRIGELEQINAELVRQLKHAGSIAVVPLRPNEKR